MMTMPEKLLGLMSEKFRNVSAVLFDLDGTLIDSAPDLGAAADKMRTDRGMAALPVDTYRHLAGSGAKGMLNVAFGITPDAEQFDAMKEEFFKNYEARMTQNTYLFEGVESLITELINSGRKWGVVTNKSQRFTLPLTAAMPLFNTAYVIVSGDTTPYAKPHPAPLIEASHRLGVRPSECVYVGDDERDIIAGKAAGMRTVAAAYGYLGEFGDTALWDADATIHSPTALLNLLQMA